jgi:hypothetical protein
MLQYSGEHETMARKPGIRYPGELYHVILRGNAGRIIFDDDQDRTQFYLLAQEGIERFGRHIHALKKYLSLWIVFNLQEVEGQG